MAGTVLWRQRLTTPASVRRQFGLGGTYPRYSGCTPGHRPHVLLRDYFGDRVVIRIAGHYAGLLEVGGTESLHLSDVRTGRSTSTLWFTPSVQDNGGSEANEPGPLLTWGVTGSGWLVYVDELGDLEGGATALVALSGAGATTLDLAPRRARASAITRLAVSAKRVSWRSSFSGAHRVTLGRALLPGALPNPLPDACKLVPPALARELLGSLSSAMPPPPPVPPTGIEPPAPSGTDRSSCGYAAAGDPHQMVDVAEQRVTPAMVQQQEAAIKDQSLRPPPHSADDMLVLGSSAAVLDSRIFPGAPQGSGTEDLRFFVQGVEIDLTTNSDRAAHDIEFAGLAIERVLRDAPPATDVCSC